MSTKTRESTVGLPQERDAVIDPAGASLVDTVLSRFTEGSRLLRFYSPLPPGRSLLIELLTGRAGISEPFAFQLSLLSQNAAIDLKDMMGKNVAFSVQQADGSEHFINGYVNSFAATRSDGGFAFYHAEVVPWTTYLKRRVNSRAPALAGPQLPKVLAPRMREAINNMPKDVLDGYIKTHGAGSHAEIYALNDAMLARPGAKPQDFLLYVVNAGGRASSRGMPIPRCPHCAHLTEGTQYFPKGLNYGD